MGFRRESLRNHLSVIVNLAMDDYYTERLTITDGEITIKNSISPSATANRENYLSATHVKLHPLPDQ